MTEKEFALAVRSAGGRLYLVGGYVRDMVRQTRPKDKDYMVAGLTEAAFVALFPMARKVGKSFPVYLLEVDCQLCEVAFARKERKTGAGYRGFEVVYDPAVTAEDDLFRRDTTINSMALELPNYQEFSDLTLNGGLMLHPDTCTWAGPLVTGIIRELVDRPRGYKTCIRGLLLSLAVFLLRTDSIKNTGPAAPSGALTPALDYIRNNYAEDFYIESLAELCHLSPTHFRRLFQKQLGTTPLDFLHQVRIVSGCSLLLTTTASIAEIAVAIGYSSLSCFNRHFLRFMGTSPSQWRRAGGPNSRRSVLTFTGWNQPESSDEILRKST